MAKRINNFSHTGTVPFLEQTVEPISLKLLFVVKPSREEVVVRRLFFYLSEVANNFEVILNFTYTNSKKIEL